MSSDRDVRKRCLLEEARFVFVRDVVTKLYLTLKAGEVDSLVLGDGVSTLADGIPHLKRISAGLKQNATY